MIEPYVQDSQKAAVVKAVALMLGVRVRDGVDTFGRPYLDIDPDGLRCMHELALLRGHTEVAEDIRQMLARGTKIERDSG